MNTPNPEGGDVRLPELPASHISYHDGVDLSPAYTAEQVRNYGRACYEAGRSCGVGDDDSLTTAYLAGRFDSRKDQPRDAGQRDVLERLREAEHNPYGAVRDPEGRASLAREAADEIERLTRALSESAGGEAGLIDCAQKAVDFLDRPDVAAILHGKGFLPIRSTLREAIHSASKKAMLDGLTKTDPDGFASVPIIPSAAMIAAGDEIIAQDGKKVRPESIYDAMVWTAREAIGTAPARAPGGDEVEKMARSLFEAQADRLAAPWEQQWDRTKQHWRRIAREKLSAVIAAAGGESA